MRRLSATPGLRTEFIALKGYFGYGNFGDDGLLLAGLSIARRIWPSDAVKVLARKAGYLDRIAPGVPVVASETEVRDGRHLLVYCGGTQMFSFPGAGIRTGSGGRGRPSWGGPLGQWVRDGRNALGQTIRRAQGRALPKAAWGVGLGPFLGNPRIEENARRLLREMVFVSVRDPASFALAQAWGVKNLRRHADLCYLPGLWDGNLEVNTATAVQHVGIIVRDWPYTSEGAASLDALLRAAARLRGERKQVTFILFGAEGDMVTRQRLAKDGESTVEWNPVKQSIPEFLAALRQFDLFVTSRFHGAVFASILRRPVVCVDVEPKLTLAAEGLAPAARLLKYPFLPESCVIAIAELNASYRLCIARMEQTVSAQRALAETCAAEFEALVRNSKEPGVRHAWRATARAPGD